MKLYEILSVQPPKYLFHGTSPAKAKKILSMGFIPRGTRKNTFGKSISFSDKPVGTNFYDHGAIMVYKFLPSARILSLNDFHANGRRDYDAVIGGPGGFYQDREIAVFNPKCISFVGWYNKMTKSIDKSFPNYPNDYHHQWTDDDSNPNLTENEILNEDFPFSKDIIIAAIKACQQEFNEGYLFYGNCGVFAIALSKWIAKKFPNLDVGLMAPVAKFNNTSTEKEIDLGNNFVDFNHVFSYVKIGGNYELFDGSGEITTKDLKYWANDTKKYAQKVAREDGYTGKLGNVDIVMAVGKITDGNAVWAVEQGTDPMCDWTDFYEFLNTL
jgi:hypothetical protein